MAPSDMSSFRDDGDDSDGGSDGDVCVCKYIAPVVCKWKIYNGSLTLYGKLLLLTKIADLHWKWWLLNDR